jgi:hypothetical protein
VWIKPGRSECSVPSYLIQLAYSSDAWAAMVKQPQNPARGSPSGSRESRREFEHAWLAFGEYDIVGVAELPETPMPPRSR